MSTISRDLEPALAVLVLEHQLLSAADAVQLLMRAQSGEAPLERLLLEAVPADKVLAVVATELGVPFADLFSQNTAYSVDDAATRKLDVSVLKAHLALPLRGPGERPAVAMADPRDTDMVEYLRSELGAEPLVVLVPAAQIRSKLVYFDGPTFEGDQARPGLEVSAALPTLVEANPVVDWVDSMLVRAANERASDVQLMFAADGSLTTRFRVDSQWRRQNMPLRGREREVVGALLSKCETIDAADRTRPQDGTFAFPGPDGRAVDVRLAMLPQAYGPTIVCRLLDPSNINRRLDDMGFDATTLEQMRRVMSAPQGGVVFIGPTGSGKTTTMYGLLKELDASKLNILTAEDPIEYRLPNIGQTQIRADLGERSLTFARTMRALLRLAPNVILVGEIRDAETAEMATHAAMSGHLVLTTLHAKNAVGTFQRLEGLGVDRFVASEAISLAVNQRLMRVLHDCAERSAPTPGEIAALGRLGLTPPEVIGRPTAGGCSGCSGTGYRGRVAAVEVLEPSQAVRNLVQEGASLAVVEARARAEGHRTILSDAFRHVTEGRTSVAELIFSIDTRSM